MNSSLAYNDFSDEEESDNDGHQPPPPPHLSLLPRSAGRPNSIPQGFAPAPEGESEIVLPMGMWAMFNRRLVSLVNRKKAPRQNR